jgi:hypothetical protein
MDKQAVELRVQQETLVPQDPQDLQVQQVLEQQEQQVQQAQQVEYQRSILQAQRRV